MKKLVISMILMAIMSISMITGCDKSLNLLPEEIVSKALEANNPIIPYHVEYKVVMRDNNKVISDNNVEEWFKPKDKKRLEMADEKGKQVTVITLYNNEMVIYSVNEKKATISKNANFSEFMGKSQKDKALDALKIYKNTHKITMKGIEKINNMEAYHIVAIPKDDKTLLGKGELWIHKDSWFIIKSIEESGDTKVETLYSKIEMNSDFKDDIFIQKFPDDVKVETNEDLMKPLEEKEITIEEASKALGKPGLIYEGNEYKLKNITLLESKELGNEVTQHYEKDGVSSFDLSAKVVEKSFEDMSSLSFGKKTTIRGNEGYVIDEKIKILCWSESGINYSLIINNPRITLEDGYKIIDKLAQIK